MVPIVLGVAMAWHSEMEISISAVLVSVVCIVLNSLKVVINSEMLTGEHKVGQIQIYCREATLEVQLVQFSGESVRKLS